MIHYARLESSARLRRVLNYLITKGDWRSTREIDRGADVCAVSTAIAELRRNGCRIEIRQVTKGRFEYKFFGFEMEQTSLIPPSGGTLAAF